MSTVRFFRQPFECDLTPGRLLRLLGGERRPFALAGRWAGGGALVGSEPVRIADPDADPAVLLTELPRLEGEAAAGAIGGGWFGWLGYGALGRESGPPRPHPAPESQLAYYDHLLHLDGDGRWWFEALAEPGREAAIEARREHLQRLVSAHSGIEPEPWPAGPASFRPVAPGEAGHVALVGRCLELIADGTLEQANLRVRLEAGWDGNPAALAGRALDEGRAAWGAAFPTPDGGVVALSPELFLLRQEDRVKTGPIKGTLPRSEDETEAEATRRALLASPKNTHEHSIAAEQARLEFEELCRSGTVEAPAEPEIETHPGLWHLITPVRGRLRPEVGDDDLLRATFPPTSIIGVPRRASMEVIADLEPWGREAFTGAMGFASPVAGLELGVLIRAFEIRDGRIWLDAGGGIVAGSDPQAELVECLDKARPAIEAIGSRIERSPGARPTDAVKDLRWAGNGRGDRPNPGRGVFETVLVRDGEPVSLERHLARLERSLRTLYGAGLPDDIEARIRAAAAGATALRATVTPDGELTVTPRQIAERELPVRLTAWVLPGGLGTHKWADRRLVDRLAAGGSTPLLVDADGTVLEAAWGNVWMVEAGRLLTPPADGRILPGTFRAGVLAAGTWEGLPVAEVAFGLDRLAAADRVLVSSALAGLLPARLEDGRPDPGDR